MSNAADKIIRYELARIRVRDLKEKINSLLAGCENVNDVEYPQGSGMYQSTGKTCLSAAYDDLKNQPDYYQSYETVLNNRESEGNCCDSCYESYKIKTGALADARKEFGNAKRAIHYAGRKLLKEAGEI